LRKRIILAGLTFEKKKNVGSDVGGVSPPEYKPNMIKYHFIAWTLVLTVCLSPNDLRAVQGNGKTAGGSLSVPSIKKTIKKLAPLHTELGDPTAGQWLAHHKEPGQTFAQYLRIRPNQLTRQRNKLYVQPIGKFSRKQQAMIKLSAEFLSIYYNCPVKILETKNETEIPASTQRNHPTWGDHQLLTSYILEKVLAPDLPADAFATIAFTSSDLWPGEGWNFVFGYASLRDRVGVWSLSRFGNPDDGDDAFKKCLQRTLKVATHETGHMFSIQHCIKYECNMQGSNSLPESDSQPVSLCPECHAKILHATGANPTERFERLIKFCQAHQLSDQLAYFNNAKATLEK
jgi:archaemetzincin